MRMLGAQEQLVLRLRFGDARRSRTQREVAALLGVPRGTVRRIERRALRKLRSSTLDPVGGGWNGWDEA